jgi:hypothetical protein
MLLFAVENSTLIGNFSIFAQNKTLSLHKSDGFCVYGNLRDYFASETNK